MMDDLISRQVALDAMGERPMVWTGGDYELGCRNQYDTDRLAIETVPSAESEIIRCNSCKHWTQAIGKMRGFGLGRCDFHDAEYVTCNGFCYWAERREQDE